MVEIAKKVPTVAYLPLYWIS